VRPVLIQLPGSASALMMRAASTSAGARSAAPTALAATNAIVAVIRPMARIACNARGWRRFLLV
jgi:hypothetical protein